MKKPKLNKSEKSLLADFDAGQYKSVLTLERKKLIKHAASLSTDETKKK